MDEKNHYTQFLKFRQIYFDEIKSKYLFEVDIARKKESAHNVFQQKTMRSEEMRFQKELGELHRFLIDIRHDMTLDSRIEEESEFNLRFAKVDKSKKKPLLKLIAEYDGWVLMYNFWRDQSSKLRDGENYFERYEKRWSEILETHKKVLIERVEKARDKTLACNKFAEGYMNPRRAALAPKLEPLRGFMDNVYEQYNLDNSREVSEIFNEKVETIEFGKREESVELLAEFHANWLMLGVEGEIHRKYSSNPLLTQFDKPEERLAEESPIMWLGTNETEFVQLVYALHEAGYLEHDGGEITKLVNQLAEFFNIQLGQHWQSNFSKSINVRNLDYSPEIFKKLPAAFQLYKEKLINKKKKN